MEKYQEARYILEGKAIEMAKVLRGMEEEMDNIHKVNVYLMRRYRDELLEEFKDDINNEKNLFVDLFGDKVDSNMKEAIAIRFMYQKIASLMKKEMPDPWYMYSCVPAGEENDKN